MGKRMDFKAYFEIKCNLMGRISLWENKCNLMGKKMPSHYYLLHKFYYEVFANFIDV